MVAIRMTKAGKEKRDRLLRANCCLICEEALQKGKRRRGLCVACRQFVRRMIGRGERTEESFIRAGELLEQDDTRGGKPASEKRKALRAGAKR